MNLSCFNSIMMWIFLFIVVTITLFLMVTYKNDREELRNRVLTFSPTSIGCDSSTCPAEIENSGSLEAQLQALSDKLAQKEQQLRASRTKISQAEQKLYTLQANSSQIQDRYKTIMNDLKSELARTEAECRKLHDHINTITKRREEIWNQVMQHQGCYEKTISCLCNDLTIQKEVLTTEPKLNKRLRDRCKQKKTIHVCTDQNEANNIKIEVCTNEESPCFCVQSSSNSRDVDGNVFALCCPEDRTTSRNETNKICPSTQQKTARCRRCGGRKKSPPCIGQPPIFCTDKINAKFQPEKFTLEEEIVEYVEPDSYECQTSAGFRRKLEIETFTNEYEETENCSPPNVCDCCVSEYEKFRQSCQVHAGMRKIRISK